ncbi:MAG: beta-glucuronidase [Bacteroidales bacterium]|nr:beta-glucuronidase [Bacteroidales bacterium]
MRKLLSSLILLVATLLPARALIVTEGRVCVSLGGQWNYIVDPMDTGIFKYQMQLQKPHKRYFADRHFFRDKTKLIEYDFDNCPTLQVPGDWNSQNDKLYFYEGSVWYRRLIDFHPVAGRRTFLYFGAVNYQCMVGLNNTILGTHKGGFTPFWFEVTDILKEGENALILWVNNSRGANEVPTLNFDWWNYGGITRDVLLISVPEVFVNDYRITFDGSSIGVSVHLDGGSGNVTVELPELGLKKKVCAGKDGIAEMRFKASPERWCPEHPKLYDISISSAEDHIADRVGFRTVRTEGDKILLNDKAVFLKGVAVHDENISANPGRCRNEQDVRGLLETAKELGCNFLRLAHYPHSEQMVRLAEEMGFLLWEEIPCYWNINWASEETYANAENQLMEMLGRDANRAATIIWSVANETPRTPERLAFLGKLIAKIRETDPTRLVSAAIQKAKPDFYHPIIEDELLDLTDLISFNQYIGWYDGKPADCDSVVWTIPAGKPVVISEFGGGALYGNHGSEDEMFTEEYLELLYRKNIEMICKFPGLCGLSPWCLKDFRSPKRPLVGIQDDFNRKGLIDEQGRHKKAFYVVKDFYRFSLFL